MPPRPRPRSRPPRTPLRQQPSRPQTPPQPRSCPPRTPSLPPDLCLAPDLCKRRGPASHGTRLRHLELRLAAALAVPPTASVALRLPGGALAVRFTTPWGGRGQQAAGERCPDPGGRPASPGGGARRTGWPASLQTPSYVWPAAFLVRVAAWERRAARAVEHSGWWRCRCRAARQPAGSAGATAAGGRSPFAAGPPGRARRSPPTVRGAAGSTGDWLCCPPCRGSAGRPAPAAVRCAEAAAPAPSCPATVPATSRAWSPNMLLT